MNKWIKLKYVATSFSTAQKQSDVLENGEYKVYGASGLVGYLDTFGADTPYIGIVKDGAGVGRTNIYNAYTSLLGTMAYIVPRNPDNTNLHFLQYAISALNLGETAGDKATIPHIYFSVYGNKYILNVPVDTQKKIATYLNQKCTQIDTLIQNVQTQIEKLKAYKQSLVTEVVTKGLDPTVPMKDSGLDWIGEIPDKWQILKFKHIATVKSNLVDPAQYLDHPQVSPENIEKGSGRLLPCRTVKEVGVESSNHLFFSGQIIYSKVRPILNKVVIAPFDGLCSADMYPIETVINKQYLVYLMLSNVFLTQVKLVTENRVKMPKINQDEISRIILCCPPDREQNDIVAVLDKKCSQIDRLIAIKLAKIEKLEQYKRSLIYEYVTGKKEVS